MDFDRLARALEAVAVGLARQVNRRSGTPQATSYTVAVDNVKPLKIAAASPGRKQLTFQNQDNLNPVTLGHDPGVTFGQGLRLSGFDVVSDGGEDVWTGEWWAIANVAGPVLIGVDDMSSTA